MAQKNTSKTPANDNKIDTAIIPVGGYGTRMFPVTQSIPKALLPVGSKPLLLHAVDEALNAGIPNIRIICRPEEYDVFRNQFVIDPVIKEKIEDTGRANLLKHVFNCETLYKDKVRVIPDPCEGGPAAAIRNVLGDSFNKAFCVILPDDLFIGKTPMGKLIQVFRETGMPIVGTRNASLKYDNPKNGTYLVNGVREKVKHSFVSHIQIKPKDESPLSKHVSCGRYVFNNQFSEIVDQCTTDHTNELSMSAVLRFMVENKKDLIAVRCKGKYFDCGDMRKYQKAFAACTPKDIIEDTFQVNKRLKGSKKVQMRSSTILSNAHKRQP